jgi:hypothetical protein
MVSVTATPDPTTGSVLIQLDQIEARDTFTRVVANDWGVATTGETWNDSGGAAADYSVNGTQGVISLTSVGTSRNVRLANAATGNDLDSTIYVTVPVLPTGASIEVDHGVRANGSLQNQYQAVVQFQTSGSVDLSIRSVVLGSFTTLASTTLAQTHTAGGQWGIRIAVCGSRVMAKSWRTTVTEPDWILAVNNHDVTTGSDVVVRAVLSSGNTNPLPVNLTFDNLAVGVSQPIRLYRENLDTGAIDEVRGSPFSTAQVTSASDSGTAVAWDNESPFNVSMQYFLTSNCSTTPLATSAPVTLTADFGWLRDPTNPSRNIEIAQFSFFDECVDEEAVVFSGLGGPLYENSSGIFPIIDAQRPRVVSQTRKKYASSLSLTSFSLNDIINLEDLYQPGTILTLSLPTSFGWALRSSGTDYIVIGDVQHDYLGVDQELTVRVWSMPFWLTGPPADTSEGGTGGNGIGGGGATYDDLMVSALGTTYNTLTASLETYDQVAAGVGY